MTKIMEAPQSSAATRLAQLLNHRVVWYTAAASLLPTLAALVILWLSEIPITPLLWSLLGASLLFGLILGVYNRSMGYHRTEALLRTYTDLLQKVAEGDLRLRLSIAICACV
jgi:hypothetical protein